MVARDGVGPLKNGQFYSLTKEKLDDLSRDRFSLIKIIHKDLTLPMPPSSVDRLTFRINKLFKHRFTYKYSTDLQGILLFHDDLELRSTNGIIRDDNPNIFWDISARFYAFCPREGAIVRGKINKFTKTQVMNALVLDCILAALTPDKVHESIRNDIALGQEILFRIDSFDSDNSLIYGSIDEECITLMKACDLFKKANDGQKGQEGSDGEEEIGTIEELYRGTSSAS
ncbi:RNA polymerase I subunit F [Brevipalpus obovatus]|uniref:RNA polymerase I subunit F n=1 Tax=Brevipalpus obovatus TaxID=246614 RepID=UPI003D9E12AC